MPRRIATSIAFLLLAVTVQAEDLAGVDIPYERHVLGNGLTVLIHEDHTAPQAFVNVYYKVGSRDERPGKTGFAHLFEHLMFNGSENADGEYFEPVQAVGGSLNGDTSFDRTRYYQTVPNTALERILWLESDRMGHLLGAVTQEKLDQQRGVVQNEKRRSDNRPYSQVFPTLLAGLFPEGHPYSWPTIGSMEDLDAAELDDVHEWFRAWYGPANAILTVAGAIDPTEALELVELHFGDIPAGPPVKHRDDRVPDRRNNTSETFQDRVANPLLFRGWALPGRDYEASAMASLAARILGGDPSSRLYRRLVKEEGLAVAASISVLPLELASIATLQVVVVPGADVDRVREVVAEELARFAAEGPTATELELTKTQIAGSIIKGLDSLSGKANLLAESEYYGGSPDAYKRGFGWIDGATRENVRAAASNWFGNGYHEILVTMFGEYSVAATGADRSEIPSVDSYPPATAPAVQDFTLRNGIPVRFVPRMGVPAVSMLGQFRVGAAIAVNENPAAAGIAMAALAKGTKKRSADDVIADLKRTGSSFNVSIGSDVTRATATTLTSKFDAAMELAADVLRNPAFDDKEVALLKDVAVASIAQAKTNPSSVANRYLEAVLYEGHPYGGMPASAEDVTALTRDDLRRAYQHRIRPQDLTLYVVGGIEPDILIDTLNRHFGDWKPVKGEALLADVMTQPETSASRVIVFDMPGAPQTNIVAAQVVDPPYQEGHTEFDLANMIYGGNFTSRINSNLREEKGWSYGVRSSIDNVAGPRTWRITAQVQTDKTADTIRELIGELQAINADRPFRTDELEKVRNERVRKLPAVTASAFGILSYLAENGLHGRADDYIEQRKGEFEAIALEELAPAFDQRVDPDRLTWFISGDLAAIRESLEALELGEIEIWDVDGKRLNQPE